MSNEIRDVLSAIVNSVPFGASHSELMKRAQAALATQEASATVPTDEQILSCMGSPASRTSARHGATIFEYRLFDLIHFARAVLALAAQPQAEPTAAQKLGTMLKGRKPVAGADGFGVAHFPSDYPSPQAEPSSEWTEIDTGCARVIGRKKTEQSSATVPSDADLSRLWDVQAKYHGGEPCKVSHIEFARAVLALAAPAVPQELFTFAEVSTLETDAFLRGWNAGMKLAAPAVQAEPAEQAVTAEDVRVAFAQGYAAGRVAILKEYADTFKALAAPAVPATLTALRTIAGFPITDASTNMDAMNMRAIALDALAAPARKSDGPDLEETETNPHKDGPTGRADGKHWLDGFVGVKVQPAAQSADAVDAKRYRLARSIEGDRVAMFTMDSEGNPLDILIGGHADNEIDAALSQSAAAGEVE